MIEAVNTFVTLVGFYQTTHHVIPEDKSYSTKMFFFICYGFMKCINVFAIIVEIFNLIILYLLQ